MPGNRKGLALGTIESSRVSRRTFLRALGTGAVAASTSGLLTARGVPAQPHQRRFVIREDRFGRIFPNLPPFATPSPALDAALRDIGKPGGILDANDNLLAGPAALLNDPALRANNPDNPVMTAGATFMGQFMDHDMTFDLSSRLGVPTEPADSANARTPALDLDSVYGGGPLVDLELYAPSDPKSGTQPTKLKLESGGLYEDVPRDRNDAAIIADPRNDENIMISGLQAAVISFHNRAVDRLTADDPRESPDEIFRRARRLTTWHYQWMIVHEFLTLFVGQAMVDDILRRGRKVYRPDVAQIPVEFQGAAYRFGHTLVRPSYRANLAGDKKQPFFGMIFDPAGEGDRDPVDLRGGCRARRRFVGWQTFFDFGAIPRPGDQGGTLGEDVRANKLIDTRLSTPLFNLPLATIASGDPPTSLAQRNLLRGVTWGLPSGQRVARAMGAPVLARQDLSELSGYGLGLDESTPLWFYVMREGRLLGNGGAHLGPVGGRIVGEVILGLLQLDRESYLQHPGWRPTLPTTTGRVTGEFRMIDFLTFAGVDPTSRGQ
jgi:hypothetical protein